MNISITLSSINYTYSQGVKKPLFAILSLPEPLSAPNNFSNQSVDGNYIYWLEQAGAEVCYINSWDSLSEIDDLLPYLNGILLQGGFRLLNFTSPWEKKLKHIFNYTLQNRLPIYGICLGFRLLNVMMSRNDSLLTPTNNHGNHNVEFTNLTKSCELFSLFTENDFNNFKNKNNTVFIHVYGITPDMFYREKYLVENYNLTSFGYDLDGRKFICSIENSHKHIYGTQFHPEKTPYIRSRKYKYLHENDSIRRSQLIAMKIVDIARHYKSKKEVKVGFRKKHERFSTYKDYGDKKIWKDKNLNMYYIGK